MLRLDYWFICLWLSILIIYYFIGKLSSLNVILVGWFINWWLMIGLLFVVVCLNYFMMCFWSKLWLLIIFRLMSCLLRCKIWIKKVKCIRDICGFIEILLMDLFYLIIVRVEVCMVLRNVWVILWVIFSVMVMLCMKNW